MLKWRKNGQNGSLSNKSLINKVQKITDLKVYFMKKIVLFVIVMVVGVSLKAQISVGLKGGTSFSSIQISPQRLR